MKKPEHNFEVRITFASGETTDYRCNWWETSGGFLTLRGLNEVGDHFGWGSEHVRMFSVKPLNDKVRKYLVV